MKKLLVSLALAAGILAFPADAQKAATGPKAGISAISGEIVTPPVGCVSTSVPFFGSDLRLACDGGLTYDAATDTLTTVRFALSPSVSLWLPPAAFVGSLIAGDGGTLLTRDPPNPIDPLSFESNGSYNGLYNTFFGIGAGVDTTSGNMNVFIGPSAGANNTIGDQNIFIGMRSGEANTSGYHNTYVGIGSGQSTATGNYNTFIGCDNGLSFVSGSENTYIGSSSGGVSGDGNVFIGVGVGTANTGSNNVFIGKGAGTSNTSGNYNLFTGFNAGAGVTTAINNTVYGAFAGAAALGNSNALFGYAAGRLITAQNNAAFGAQSFYALTTGYSNAAFGMSAGQTLGVGYGNTFLGQGADTNAADSTNRTAVGYLAVATANNQVVLGNSSVTDVLAGGTGGATLTAGKFKLSALNTAPASASATGTTGDIRVTATAIYVCIATNTWVKADLATW